MSRARWGVLATAMAIVAVSLAPPVVSWAADTVPGSAGTDTSIPLTRSFLTVSGRGKFAGLKVTVNQTKDLANQAISVTWNGGMPTEKSLTSIAFGSNFLQMFQCWGDDDGSNPDNPGPPPQQCEQGATNGVYGGRPLLVSGRAATRTVSRRGDPSFDPTLGTLYDNGEVEMPFRSVDGTVVPLSVDTEFNPNLGGGNYWLNSFFNVITTNEVNGAQTARDGTGSELFEATTGEESSGLGCGQKAQPLPDGSTKVPRCWLVVVPRGGVADEMEGTNYDVSGRDGVAISPLAPVPWRNRLAFPLEFKPVDSSCSLSAQQRRIVGSELLSGAVISWQPSLCATPGLSPYAYSATSDTRARQQLLGGGQGAAGMAVVLRPADPATVDPQNPVVYAPLTISGTVIGFNVDRASRGIFPEGQRPSPEVLAAEAELARVRVAHLNLTPRLVAKLLTQSYRSQVEIENTVPPDYPWVTKNPSSLADDPDFVQFNPEFNLLQAASARNMGGLVLPAPNSDSALQVWEWVFADPEARRWLAGEPDPFGMKINPVYSTSGSTNPQGVGFGDPLPDSYPKSDPYCFTAPQSAGGTSLCGLDWKPYSSGLRASARLTRSANDNAKVSFVGGEVKSEPPPNPGQRSLVSVTDTASAAQYGVQMARLSRAGDNNPDRGFVAPDQAGLAAGAQALTAKAVPGFLEPNPAAAPPGAYPLTALAYAAVTPLSLDATARKEYAAFVDYAAGPGQTPGLGAGQLPSGYQPLSDALRDQAKAAAAKIRDLKLPGAPPDSALATSAPAGTSPSASLGPAGVGTSGQAQAQSPAIAPTATPPPVLPKTSKSRIETIAQALRTPFYRAAATRWALPLLVVLAVVGALGALEITKRRSRAVSEHGDQQPGTTGEELASIPAEGTV